MVWYPNARQQVAEWIVISCELIDSIIVYDEISLNDLPPVQLISLYSDPDFSEYKNELRENINDAIFEVFGTELVSKFEIPTKVDLLNSSKHHPLPWDPVVHMSENDNQSMLSFNEQKHIISICKETIDAYTSLSNIFTKSMCIRGFPGAGKTWSMLVIEIYAICRGLTIYTTTMMAKRAIQSGGKHWHYLFGLPTGRNLSPHQISEQAILQIIKTPKILNFIKSIDV